MQLKLTTDYAIRTVVYLATQSGITSVAEIGSKMGISENYLMKVLKALKDAGLVAGYQGKRGGYAISKKPEEISLWDIVEVMEGTTKMRVLQKSIGVWRLTDSAAGTGHNSVRSEGITKDYRTRWKNIYPVLRLIRF